MPEVDGNSWAPNFDSGETAARTEVGASPPFLLMAHRRRWGVVRGKIRPLLGRLKLIPGVANVSVGTKGTTRVGMARIHYEAKGWTILPTSTLPPSQRERKSYLSRPEGRDDVTLCYWEQVFAGSTAKRCDEKLHDEFLDHIVKSGLVPPPELYVLERLRNEATEEHEKALDRATTYPSYKNIAKLAADRVKIIDAAIAEREGDRAPVGSSAVVVEDGE